MKLARLALVAAAALAAVAFAGVLQPPAPSARPQMRPTAA